MNEEQRAMVEALRSIGFAVIVWTPEELQEAPASRVEDRLVELGWEVIDCLK